jgi:hypothetical protein
MIADDRITLREAARRLSGYRRFQNTRTRGKQELLKVLQDGKIQAAFDFPSAARPRISIPAEFWLDIQSGHFQKLLTWSKKSERYRQFLVEPVKFIGQYTALFGDSYFGGTVSTETRTIAFAELESAFAKINKKKEAYILESEWARFVQSAGLEQVEHHDEVAQSTKGRKPLEAWEFVLVEVASVMLAMQAQGRRLDGEQSTIAADAISRAEKKFKHRKFPEIGTVAKKISLVLAGMEELMPSAGD